MTHCNAEYLAIGTSAASALATWVLGLVAAVIAVQQLMNSMFRPQAQSICEASEPEDPRRIIVVRITNRGGAAGMVESIDMVHSDHLLKGRDRDVSVQEKYYPNWELDQPPLPFLLPEKSSAVIVLGPCDEKGFDKGRRAFVTYGNGKQVCVRLEHKKRINLEPARTAIPPGPLVNMGKKSPASTPKAGETGSNTEA